MSRTWSAVLGTCLAAAIAACATATPYDPSAESDGSVLPDVDAQTDPSADARPDNPQDPDFDDDGFAASVDCDDNDDSRYPGADERCDGADQDCDDAVDEAAVDALTYFQDSDDDGFGDADVTVLACSAPAGFVDNDEDCYDDNNKARPGQSQYFFSDRGDGSFDYNCSQTAETRTPLGACEEFGFSCDFDSGWMNTAPSCGSFGQVIDSCARVCNGFCECVPVTSTSVQACR